MTSLYGKLQTASVTIASLGLNLNRVGRPLKYDTQNITHAMSRTLLKHSMLHIEFSFSETRLFTLSLLDCVSTNSRGRQS